MYCTSVFCRFITYSSISLNPDSYIDVSIGRYYQLPSNSRRGFLPMIHCATLCWNPPRDRPMWGVSTHVPTSKIRPACTTYLKNIPDNLVLAPSLPIIIDRQAQLFRDFHRLTTTAGQFPHEAVKIRPKYFKYAAISSGLP